MVYLTKDTQNRQSFLPNIWLKLVGHISDWVFVAPIDIESTLLVDMQPYGCLIVFNETGFSRKKPLMAVLMFRSDCIWVGFNLKR